MAVSCGLEESRWATKLAQALRSTAYEVFSRLTREEQQNYTTLKTALLSRFEVDAESYKLRFKAARKEPGESYAQLVERLKSYIQRWTCLGGFEENYEGLREMIIIDQIKGKMQNEMKAFLTQNGADRLEL